MVSLPQNSEHLTALAATEPQLSTQRMQIHGVRENYTPSAPVRSHWSTDGASIGPGKDTVDRFVPKHSTAVASFVTPTSIDGGEVELGFLATRSEGPHSQHEPINRQSLAATELNPPGNNGPRASGLQLPHDNHINLALAADNSVVGETPPHRGASWWGISQTNGRASMTVAASDTANPLLQQDRTAMFTNATTTAHQNARAPEQSVVARAHDPTNTGNRPHVAPSSQRDTVRQPAGAFVNPGVGVVVDHSLSEHAGPSASSMPSTTRPRDGWTSRVAPTAFVAPRMHRSSEGAGLRVFST